MATPCAFLDVSIFPVTYGPRPTLSRKPCQNRTKIEEKLKIPTSEFYIRDIGSTLFVIIFQELLACLVRLIEAVAFENCINTTINH